MNNYVVVDVETSNSKRDICSIAVLEVKNNRVVNSYYSLINPESYFEPRSINVNHITEKDVIDKPTFKEFWNVIGNLMTENILIVQGDNQFDCNAICKNLERYNIEVPVLTYLDTCTIAKRYLSLEDYGLDSLARYVGYSFRHHNALEDTKATYQIFEYFLSHFNVGIPQKYYFNMSNQTYGWQAKQSALINELIGIITGISYDGSINKQEMDIVNKWINDALPYKDFDYYEAIIQLLRDILRNNYIDYEERLKLMSLAKFLSNNQYSRFKKANCQILKGILTGITADGKLSEDEVYNLKAWLDVNSELKEDCLFCEIYDEIQEILQDGILTAEEESHLLDIIDEMLHPIKKSGTIDLNCFNGKYFVLTQDFAHFIPRKVLEDKLVNLGGIKRGDVSKKTNYLIVGSLTSDANKYGDIGGGKIAKAKAINEKGGEIIIVYENDLPKELFD